jgi:hypothetical protein
MPEAALNLPVYLTRELTQQVIVHLESVIMLSWSRAGYSLNSHAVTNLDRVTSHYSEDLTVFVSNRYYLSHLHPVSGEGRSSFSFIRPSPRRLA